MDERIDVLDASGGPTGEIVWKSEAHRLGLWHRCFHCWVVDPGGPSLLVQRRAAGKETWPECLDVSAAGHLRSGESVVDGLRELEEELGLSPSPDRLIPLGERRVEQEISGGLDREFHEVFLLFDSTPPGDLRLQREEVESVVRLGLDVVERLCGGEDVTAEEWSGGDRAVTRVGLADFVPGSPLSWVVRVACEALDIRRPDRTFSSRTRRC